MSRPVYEIADVFRRYGTGFQTTYARFLGPLQLLVLKALAACRTPDDIRLKSPCGLAYCAGSSGIRQCIQVA